MLVLVAIVLVGLLGPLVLQVNPFSMVAAPYTEPGDNRSLAATTLVVTCLFGVIYGTRATLGAWSQRGSP